MEVSVNKIKAYRDGQTREFTLKVWDVMGIGHCGWTAVPEVPKEVGMYAPPGSQKTEGILDFKGVTQIDTKPRKTRQRK